MAPRSISRSTDRPGTVLVGVIRGAHGVRGEVRVAPETDNPGRFAAGRAVEIDGLGARTIESVRGHKGELIVRFDGIADRETAQRLRGRELRVPIDDARREAAGH